MVVGVLFFESQTGFLMLLFEIKRILLQEFDKVVLTGHLFENLYIFCSFKVQCVLTFKIINGENDPSLQECSITTWKDNLLFDLQKFKYSSWLSKLPVKTKRSQLLVSNNDI